MRLTLADGTEFTEDAIGHLALFVARGGAETGTVEMLDADGTVLGTHAAF